MKDAGCDPNEIDYEIALKPKRGNNLSKRPVYKNIPVDS